MNVRQMVVVAELVSSSGSAASTADIETVRVALGGNPHGNSQGKGAMTMRKRLVAGLMAGLLFLCSQANAVPAITDGLVAAYEFDGNADDSSGNGNHGTVHGAALTVDRFGSADGAYAFDGNDYIVASGTPLPTAERTVALWFRADAVSNKPVLVGYGGSDAGGRVGRSWMMGINHWGHAAYAVTSHWDTNTLEYYYPEEPVGRWRHYAIATDGAGTRIYIDGSEKASNSNFINNTEVAGTDLSIGVAVNSRGIAPYTDGNAGYYTGLLDDVLIYDRALTQSEINQLIPEPATLALLALGGLALIRRKRK